MFLYDIILLFIFEKINEGIKLHSKQRKIDNKLNEFILLHFSIKIL